MVGYLFNRKHQEGWPKGQWFVRALGFNPDLPEHARILESQILFDEKTAVLSRVTKWGTRFEQDLTITGPNGKSIDGITAIWQCDLDSDIIRLLTLLPPKK